jgi:type VI secretion system protein ImpG
METTSRKKLQDYFVSELEALRGSATDFQADYPAIASELVLSEGISRDPHVEHLVQSFAWMMARLQLQLDGEAHKLPRLVVDHMHPNALASVPAMAVVECDFDPSAANAATDYLIPGGHLFVPTEVEQKMQDEGLKDCKFATCFDSVVHAVRAENCAYEAEPTACVAKKFPRALSALKMCLSPSESGVAVSGSKFSKPVRFYINAEPKTQRLVHEVLSKHVLGLVMTDASGKLIRTLESSRIDFCGFSDDERMLPQISGSESGYSLLQDYFVFPQKFMFFEVSGLEGLDFPMPVDGVAPGLTLYFALSQQMARGAALPSDLFKTNCFPVVNLFDKISEPILLKNDHYKHKVLPSSQHPDNFEVFRIREVFQVEDNGAQQKLDPYLQFCDPVKLKAKPSWIAQQEDNPRRHIAGTDTWLSVFGAGLNSGSNGSPTLYAQMVCSNRRLGERLLVGQAFKAVGASPLRTVKLLTRPTKYRPAKVNADFLWEAFSFLTLYQVALFDPASAKEQLAKILGLYVSENDLVGLAQIQSVKTVSVSEKSFPNTKGGWRGYLRGTQFCIDLDGYRFEGSPFLFGSILQRFLGLFSHINNFVCLELRIDGEGYHQWKPISGRKTLA